MLRLLRQARLNCIVNVNGVLLSHSTNYFNILITLITVSFIYTPSTQIMNVIKLLVLGYTDCQPEGKSCSLLLAGTCSYKER